MKVGLQHYKESPGRATQRWNADDPTIISYDALPARVTDRRTDTLPIDKSRCIQ